MNRKNHKYLFEQLNSHHQKQPISFHVPGHKMGKGLDESGKTFFQDILQIDVTEITGLDDLHQPTSVIFESEKRAARIFGSKTSFFLVNGSTSGNLAMILSTCKPGDKIIIQRNAHKSVINGIILARAIPIYVQPEYICTLGIWGSVRLESIQSLLKKHPDTKAVFLMNPNYYGMSIDLAEIADLVHSYHIPLLVDEAHGAHFGIRTEFPKSALQMGADLVVQSTHKTLSAMTMGSMLHINYHSFIDMDRVKFFLSVVQTSSPSYPIMASLDLTCQLIEAKGQSLWDGILDAVHWLHEKSTTLRGIEVEHRLPAHYFLDPLKGILKNRFMNLTGFELQSFLERANIYTELADLQQVLAVFTFGNTYEEMKALYNELAKYDDLYQDYQIIEGNKDEEMEYNLNTLFEEHETIVSLDQVIYGNKRTVPIEQAIGEVSAEMVIPYPPGIPCIQLGERITSNMIDYLLTLKMKGAKFQGVKDTSLSTLQILVDES